MTAFGLLAGNSTFTRYRILSDGDCHRYLIPVGKEEAFRKWCEAAPYWDDYDGETFDAAQLESSLNCYTFTDFKEDK